LLPADALRRSDAAWYGEGNRGGRIGGFLMGLKVLDESDDKGDDV
jgi:hypothetical protein